MDAEKLIEEAGRVSATRKWPMYLADLLHSLAAALRETTAREQATIASLRCAEGSLKEYAAANVAANKRIEALEYERDEAREWVRKMVRETQTLTCVYCGHAYPPGTPTHGSEVLTAHIEQCERHPARRLVLERDAARAELARLTTPRPIAEAPKDGRDVLVLWINENDRNVTPEVMYWDDERAKWMRGAESEIWEQQPTHFLPLPVLP